MAEYDIRQDEEFIATRESLKKLLMTVKGSENPERIAEVKKEFKEILRTANPLMIALAEQDLVKEGFRQEDLVSACDIHLELFRESLEYGEIDVPDGHPIARFQQDHRIILSLMEELRERLKTAGRSENAGEIRSELERAGKLVELLLEAENHNVRQENTLFPMLERHGIEQPPAIMWMEHTEMKEDKKKLRALLGDIAGRDPGPALGVMESIALRLVEKFATHTQKEQNILYRAALDVLSEEEWNDIREECDNLGYFGDAIGARLTAPLGSVYYNTIIDKETERSME